MTAPLPDGNPKLPDHINNSDRHPLQDFLLLAAGLLGMILLLTLLLAWSAHWTGPRLPYEWERQWFAATEQQAELTSHPAETALQNLLNELLQHQTDPLPVSVHWLDEDLPNAFAVISGHIFVTRGLIRQVSSENALAMVLAHEYAHIELRHPVILLLEQLSLTTLATVIGGDAAAAIGQHTGLLTVLAFSRDMERAADLRALEMLQQHYGHTEGATEFFEHMLAQRDEAQWAAMFQTHPLTRERIKQIEKTAPASGELTPLPAVFLVEKGN